MIKAKALLLSSLALPLVALADSPCPSYQFQDTGHYVIYFRTGEVARVDPKRRAVSMFIKDFGQLLSSERSISLDGTTLVHRRIVRQSDGLGIGEELGAAINVLPNGQIIAVQPAAPKLKIPATTIIFDGRSRTECVVGNKELDYTEAQGPITSEFAAGRISSQLGDLELLISDLSDELESVKTTASQTQSELLECSDALGLSQNKVAGLESEVAIFDANGKLSRVTLDKPLRRIQSSINDLQDVNNKDRKALKSLVNALKRIRARSNRGLFERPAISSNN